MQFTRQQIMEYLGTNRMATPLALSRALQVTDANIRHHLKLLLEQNLVEVVGQEKPRGRGRPRFIYSLTLNAQQNNLAGLASALLHTLLTNKSLEEQKRQLAALAQNMPKKKEAAPAGLRQRLDWAVKILHGLRYQPGWEASAVGPRIILGVCPYAEILPDHPELCQLDATLINHLVDRPVEQTAKLEKGPEGVPHCIFAVQ